MSLVSTGIKVISTCPPNQNFGDRMAEETEFVDQADVVNISLSTSSDVAADASKNVKHPDVRMENEKSMKQNVSTQPQSGVIYLSRIPPGVEPNTLRSLLSGVGRTSRIWLRPIAAVMSHGGALKKGQVDSGGRDNASQDHAGDKYADGWIEFPRRRDAKRAVALLNGNPMAGAKKKGRFANDLWAMRFLPKFTWDDLSREVFGSQRERVLEVREQVADARRERAWVESRVALSGHIRKKQLRRGQASKPKRKFAQKVVKASSDDVDMEDARAEMAAAKVERELEDGIAQPLDQALVAKLFRRSSAIDNSPSD